MHVPNRSKTHRPRKLADTTGLAKDEQRRLLRVSLWIVAGVAVAYAVLRLLTHDPVVAAIHAALCVGCVLYDRQIRKAHNLTPWTVGLLAAVYIYLVAFMLPPGMASGASFAWAYLMPVASYLLLGRFLGFIIAAPFMMAIAVIGVITLLPLNSETDWLVLLDATIIGALTLVFLHYYETLRAKDRATLEQLARTDPLTGLENRRSFMATLQKTIAESERSYIGFSLVIMDIDHFKQVNDDFGHDAGDRVLQYIAQQLNERLRGGDSAGRLGGEEFGLILRGASRREAYNVVEDLRQRTAAHAIDCATCHVSITTTSGIADWPHDADNADDLYRSADRRLYQGKRTGRNTTVPAPDTQEPAMAITQ